jgi:hypothetical protein
VQNSHCFAIAFSTLLVATNLLHAVPSQAGTKTNLAPTSGKVLQLINGDLMCYVELIDSRGKKYQLGADFGACGQSKLVNKRVQLTYQQRKVNDCQSSEPCGKTRLQNLVVGMKLLRGK